MRPLERHLGVGRLIYFILALFLVGFSTSFTFYNDYVNSLFDQTNFTIPQLHALWCLHVVGYSIFLVPAFLIRTIGVVRTLTLGFVLFYLPGNLVLFFLLDHRWIGISYVTFAIFWFMISIGNGFMFAVGFLTPIYSFDKADLNRHFAKIVGGVVASSIFARFFLSILFEQVHGNIGYFWALFAFMASFVGLIGLVLFGALGRFQSFRQSEVHTLGSSSPTLVVGSSESDDDSVAVASDNFGDSDSQDSEFSDTVTNLRIGPNDDYGQSANGEKVLRLRERILKNSCVQLFGSANFWVFLAVFSLLLAMVNYVVESFARFTAVLGLEISALVQRLALVFGALSAVGIGIILDFLRPKVIRFYVLSVMAVVFVFHLFLVFFCEDTVFFTIVFYIDWILKGVLEVLVALYVVTLFGVARFGENFGLFQLVAGCLHSGLQLILEDQPIVKYDFVIVCVTTFVAFLLLLFKIRVTPEENKIR